MTAILLEKPPAASQLEIEENEQVNNRLHPIGFNPFLGTDDGLRLVQTWLEKHWPMLSQIQVPPFQRPLDYKRAKTIADQFDPRVADQILVSVRPDGSWHTYDGQHRLISYHILYKKLIDESHVVMCEQAYLDALVRIQEEKVRQAKHARESKQTKKEA
jgi:hypothetical protein